MVVLGTVARLTGFNIFRFISVHQGRTADRTGHQLVGSRAATR
ncbi:hypothetical protein ACU4GD_39155 [Cupriavidus basilensis]